MNIRQLKQLPSASFIFLLGCLGIWLGVNQYVSSLIYERQRLSNEQDSLLELTKKWKFEHEKNNAADAASSLVGRIQQERLQNYEKRTQEYKELFLIENAIKEKTFDKQISEWTDMRDKMNWYIRGYNYIAEKMNQQAKQILNH